MTQGQHHVALQAADGLRGLLDSSRPPNEATPPDSISSQVLAQRPSSQTASAARPDVSQSRPIKFAIFSRASTKCVLAPYASEEPFLVQPCLNCIILAPHITEDFLAAVWTDSRLPGIHVSLERLWLMDPPSPLACYIS